MLNSLADILATFRLGKYGMMADVTKCFFQIGLPLDQTNLFRILCFNNHDIDEEKVKAFRFTRHAWGVKSSPFIANYAIQKNLEDNVTGSSDLTRDLSQKKIHIDDLNFGVDNLYDVFLISNEAIELFDSRGFRLVKGSGNKEVVPVLSEFDKDVLVAGIREPDLLLDTNERLPDTKALGCVLETGEDRFRIVSSLKPLDKYTRRSMLSQMGKLFDPLGIFLRFLSKLGLSCKSWLLTKKIGMMRYRSRLLRSGECGLRC